MKVKFQGRGKTRRTGMETRQQQDNRIKTLKEWKGEGGYLNLCPGWLGG